MVFTSRKANQLEKDLEINPYSGLKRRVKLTTMNTHGGTIIQVLDSNDFDFSVPS